MALQSLAIKLRLLVQVSSSTKKPLPQKALFLSVERLFFTVHRSYTLLSNSYGSLSLTLA